MPPQLRSLLWYVSAWLGRAESDGKSPRFMVKRVGLEPIKPSSLPSGGMGEEGRAQPREARPRAACAARVCAAACAATGCARQRVRPQGVCTRVLWSWISSGLCFRLQRPWPSVYNRTVCLHLQGAAQGGGGAACVQEWAGTHGAHVLPYAASFFLRCFFAGC